MQSEKSREAKLRRVAKRNFGSFYKLRYTITEMGMQVNYILADSRNFVEAYFECLEDAETYMLPEFESRRIERETAVLLAPDPPV